MRLVQLSQITTTRSENDNCKSLLTKAPILNDTENESSATLIQKETSDEEIFDSFSPGSMDSTFTLTQVKKLSL